MGSIRQILDEQSALRNKRTMNVHRYLDLSTSHLPQALLEDLNGIDGLIARKHPYGFWLHVPDDIDQQVDAYDLPDKVVAILRHARSLDCDWINLDGEGGIEDTLPTWDW